MKPIIPPSILSANSAHLINDIKMINGSEAGQVHIDIMDGVLVPNISSGLPVLKYVAKLAEKPLNIYLTVVQPKKFTPEVKTLSACITNVHYEACPHLRRVVWQIREAGTLLTVTTNPATPVVVLRDIIDDVYMVLVVSVNSGFGGQKFIEHTIDKVRELRELITVTGSEALIEVDGGINLEADTRLATVGADVLVVGNTIFSVPDLVETIYVLRNS